MSTTGATHSYQDKRFCGRETDKKLILMSLFLKSERKKYFSFTFGNS